MVGWPCLRFRYQVVVREMENHRWGVILAIMMTWTTSFHRLNIKTNPYRCCYAVFFVKSDLSYFRTSLSLWLPFV